MVDRIVTVPDSLELPAAVKVPSARLSDSTPTGRSVLTAANAAAARTAIGAGTSNMDAEAVQDIVGAMVTGAGGTYDDAAGTITLPSVVRRVTLDTAGRTQLTNDWQTDREMLVVYAQDATGGRTVTFDGKLLPLNKAAGSVTVVRFVHDGAKWVAFSGRNMQGLSALDNYNNVNGIVVQTGEGTFNTTRLLGTTRQIDVASANGIGGAPILSVPKNPMLMQPLVAASTFGAELAPAISSWTGVGGATWNGTAWVIPAKGQIKANVAVTAGVEYLVDVTYTDTSAYGGLTPFAVISLGSVSSAKQFAGFSDALIDVSLVAAETGTVELVLGDGVEDWTATITNVSVKPVTAKVTPAGKLGVGSFDVTTFANSIAVGNGLQKRVNGDHNTAFGMYTLEQLTTGNYNTAVGSWALRMVDTGHNNVAIGYQPLRQLRTGYYNIGIGYSVMSNTVGSSWNIGIGNESLRDLTTGHRNTAVGSRAFNSLTTGNENIAMGREAGFYPASVTGNATTTGSQNAFLGYRSGQSHNENTDWATTVGAFATARTNGTALGRGAKAAGKGSVAIGVDSNGDAATTFIENEIQIGTPAHTTRITGRLVVTQRIPTGTADPQGQVGEITSDDSFVYVKTTAGWKRAALSTW